MDLGSARDPGSPVGKVMLVTGPAGVGKSTAARAWAARLGRVAVSHDHVRAGLLDVPGDRRWQAAMRRCASVARRASDMGQHVVIDAYLTCDEGPLALGGWRSVLHGLDVRVVVLTAEFATVRARNAQRSGEARMPEPMLADNYCDAQPWLDLDVPVIDTTNLTAGDVVVALEHCCSDMS